MSKDGKVRGAYYDPAFSKLAFWPTGERVKTERKTMTQMTTRENITALFPLVPKIKGWTFPKYVICGRQQYRGKLRYVAGYSHFRMYSHHMSGRVYDRILGYGETQDEAIAMMRKKLESKP